MLLSRAEQAKLGLYHAYNQDPEPHSSAFLANLVSFMVSKLQPTLKTHTLIELCCRDFEFAQDYANGPAWSIWGIDLKDPESTDFRTRGTSADPSFTFTKADVFASTPESGAVPRTDEPTLIYCRPPEQIPLTQFEPSLEIADEHVRDFLTSRARQLQTLVDVPSPLSVSEWYYVFLAASLACERPDSIAVVQVSNRLLNLARAADGRRLLCQLGLLTAVVLLPNTIAANSDGYALLFLSDRKPNEPYFLFDGRSFDNKPMTSELMHQIQDSISYAYAKTTDVTHWRLGDRGAEKIWPLLPSAKSTSFAEESFVRFGSVADIRRGIPRSTLLKMPQMGLSRTDRRIDCYYLSLKHLVDGTVIGFEDLPERVSDTDIYDMGDTDPGLFYRLKPLGEYETCILISRFGPPFKLTLVVPGSMRREPVPQKPQLCPKLIVPCDVVFCASFKDELLARFFLAYLSSDEGQQKLLASSHGDSLAQLSPKDLRSMTVPVPGRAEQERYALEYEAKQRAYEDALKQAEHYAASKETM